MSLVARWRHAWVPLFAAVLAIGFVAGSSQGAVVEAPAAAPVDIPPTPVQRSFAYPLKRGNPLDFAHWAHWRHPELSPADALAKEGGNVDKPTAQPRAETVVIKNPRVRPALYTLAGDIDPAESVPSEWFDVLNDRRAQVADVVRAVGRIEVSGLNTQEARYVLNVSAGTGFVVGKNVLMTNRHVVEQFQSADRKGFKRNHETDQEASVWINFDGVLNRDAAETARRLRITRILYVAPDDGPDVALLAFADPQDIAPEPLRLQDRAPDEPVRLRRMFVCGFPSGDYRYFGIPAVKRVAPGFFQDVSKDDGRNALFHDASTSEGNSGSPAVDLATGRVYGLHSHGDVNQNRSEPMWDVLAVKEVRAALNLSKKAPVAALAPSAGPDIPRPSLVIQTDRRAIPNLTSTVERRFEDVAVSERKLVDASRAVGVVESVDVTRMATGFLVAPDVMMTADYVIDEASPGYQVSFRDSPSDRDMPSWTASGVLMRHPSGFALLRIEGLLLPVKPLVLDERPLQPNQPIGIVAYNFTDYRIPSAVFSLVFAGPDGAKRLSLGRILQISGEGTERRIIHDASTSGGAAGGPVLDLVTGAVVGVHSSGSENGNTAIAIGDVIRADPKLRKYLREIGAKVLEP